MITDTYREYFDAMPCYLSVQDRDLKIIEANERFVKNFGDPSGRYCYQVYKQRPEKCEDCPVERTFQDGRRHHSEQLVRTLDGREVSILVNTAPIRDDGGEITAVMEMSTNITEIKRLQHQLRSSKRRYRSLFEDVPCFISIQDRDLRIVEANRLHREAFGTGYGCKCYQVYKQRDRECSPCIVRQTFADGEIREHEEVVTRRDGEQMNVMVTTAPVRGADGEIEGVIEMSVDITQLRELQSKLSSVGMVISTISHDLKGLLNGMDGGMYLVNSGLAKDNQQRLEQGWEMVQRNVERIRSTVLDILYYAKDRELEWQDVSASDVVAEVRSVLDAKAATSGITFSAGIELEDEDFAADRQALRSMLVNMVDNAFDACRLDKAKAEHAVSLRVTGDADEIRFTLEDNGLGMSREIQEKAFTLFFSSKGAGGTGLGLFIANKIVQSHGGRMELASEPGLWTRFDIVLPRRRPAAVSAAAAPDRAQEAAWGAALGETETPDREH
ncbi:MAG: PAS domain-containing sensor histidine kinase [bacterium]|nr:PAS domain-containing sensor histidine kinase [bacterium]